MITRAATLTIPEMLGWRVLRRPNRNAIAEVVDGQLQWRTWAMLDQDVRRCAAWLLDQDIRPGDHVAQARPTSYAWVVADLAIQMVGAVHVALHDSIPIERRHMQVQHSESKLLIDENTDSPGSLPGNDGRELPVYDGPVLCDQDSVATLLYTSGTGGDPRGVLLSQRNLASNASALSKASGGRGNEVVLSFLPFSHIYARTCDLNAWLLRGAKIVLAERRETILRDCKLAQPEVINAVPYFFQKMLDRLQAEHEAGRNTTLVDMLGGKIQRCHCGGAALAPNVEQAFHDNGIPLLSGYGLTEASPVISAAVPDTWEPGTVGRPLPGVEVKIGPACEEAAHEGAGEIMVRGPSVMLGYWKDKEATDKTIQDGWLHTGDLGRLDDQGRLWISGRSKELYALCTGKKVNPTYVETLLAASPWIEQIAVVGDGRKGLAAIIVPNPDRVRAEIRRRRLWVWSKRRALTHPKILRVFEEEINERLQGANKEEQIHAFQLIGRAFSTDTGEITPKLSLRRKVIEKNFAAQIAAMYGDPV